MTQITTRPFGAIDGKDVTRFTLTNSNGVSASVISYGATIQAIHVPDRDGGLDDITLGFDTLDEYTSEKNPFFGAVCGRVANRVAGGRFTLDEQEYTLALNDNGINSLHGGTKGFDKYVWDTEVIDDSVRFSMLSADGDEGYPGTLTVAVTYSLSDDNTLAIDYKASTDRTTIINLTNHAYFNLAGHGAGDVLGHEAVIRATHYTPVDEETLIPSGEVAPVEETPFDFRTPRPIGAQMDVRPRGYDINFCLDDVEGATVRIAEPTTGRTIEMETTEPGVQLYTSFFLQDTPGKSGAVYRQFGGFCLEAQHYPDSIHHPSFPSTVLRPGETYSQRTSYTFGVA